MDPQCAIRVVVQPDIHSYHRGQRISSRPRSGRAETPVFAEKLNI